jgi:hypothetical protein
MVGMEEIIFCQAVHSLARLLVACDHRPQDDTLEGVIWRVGSSSCTRPPWSNRASEMVFLAGT